MRGRMRTRTEMSSGDLGLVALFGAAGAVGHALAPALEARGVPYRAIGRDVERVRREFSAAEAMRADLLSGEGVVEAARGVETIFYLAGAPYTQFRTHPIMVKQALDAAEKEGVKRFVLVSPVYSYGMPQARPVSAEHPHEPQTRKGRFRLEQERAVLERDGRSLRTLVVHLPDFYGPYADLSYADHFMREALSGATASWLGSLEADREFVYVPDCAAPLLALASRNDAYGRRWNLGGSVVRARDFADAVFAAVGRTPKYRSIPKVVVQGVGLFDPFMREVAEMYYLFNCALVLDDAETQSLLGGYAKTPVPQGIAETIAWMRTHPAQP